MPECLQTFAEVIRVEQPQLISAFDGHLVEYLQVVLDGEYIR